MKYHITKEAQSYWDEENEPKAEKNDVAHIEAALSITLPSSYVDFITQYGFVTFSDGFDGFDYYHIFRDRKEIHRGGVSFLHESEEIMEVYVNVHVDSPEDNLPLIPPGYLPVGSDAGQGMILLQIEGDQVGSVWYWEYKEWAWGVEDNTSLGFVADDFYDFINNLKDYEAE